MADRNPPAPVVKLRQVELSYGDTPALTADDAQIPGAAITAVIGPNGSGKSTLIAAIAGLIRPTRGQIEVFGRPPAAVHRRVGIVLQHLDANPYLPVTVREVVRMARFAKVGMMRPLRRADHLAVDAALERLDLLPLAHRHLHELSGGQRQRALVAQGLAQEADLLLLDEPVSGVDLVTRQQVHAAIRQELAAGRAVVLATHDMGDAQAADHVLLLAGNVTASGPPETVLTREHLGTAYGSRLLELVDLGIPVIDEHSHGTVQGPTARAR